MKGSNNPPTVNISVSPCEEADRLGYDERQISRIVIRVAQFFLFKGMRVLFGHDWRDNGVMRAVLQSAELAEAASLEPGRGARMLNLVAKGDAPLSGIGLDAAKDADGVLEIRSMDDETIAPTRQGDRCAELWALRKRLTQMLDPGCRICLGGRTSGYAGHYAGVAEEAYFALSMGKPLYLIGGFGGATGAVCNAIMGAVSSHANGADPFEPRTARCTVIHSDAPLPLSGFRATFREFGLNKLSKDNGLSPDDNQRLFEMTDIEAALGLIQAGMGRRRSASD